MKLSIIMACVHNLIAFTGPSDPNYKMIPALQLTGGNEWCKISLPSDSKAKVPPQFILVSCQDGQSWLLPANECSVTMQPVKETE